MRTDSRIVKFQWLAIIFSLFWQLSVAQNINHPDIKCPGGVWVNSFNRNMHMKRNDLFIKGRKLNLDISFYYNSMDHKKNYGFGNGWSFQFFMQYNLDSNGITLTHPDGRKDLYVVDSLHANSFIAAAGIFDSLSEYESGKYVLITKGKMKYFFDNAQHRRLTRIEEPNSNFLNFSYNDSLLTQLTDPAGRSIQLTYSSGKLSTVTDAIESPVRTIKYKYDAYGNLIEVTDPLENKIQYKYLVNGPMSTVTDKNKNVIDIIYESTFAVKEIISCITDQRISYNAASKTTYLVEAVESGNQVTYFQYDDIGNLIKKTGNCCGYNNSFEYDNNRNITGFTDANGNKYEYTYDNNGNLLSKKDPMGNYSSYTYEYVFNKVTSYIDKKGNVTTYSYDNKGNITKANYPLGVIRSFTYDSNGDMASSTDGNGNTITYSYDDFGNQLKINKPLAANTSMNYDSKSRRISTTDARGNTTNFTYDLVNRLIAVTDALNHAQTISYDANGNLIKTTDRNNNTTTINYDALNRPVSIIDALNHSSLLIFDAHSNITAITDANGNTNHFAYDNLNRLVQTSNAMNETTGYSYDGKGKLVSLSLPTGNVYYITYDALSRPLKVTDNLGSFYTYSYDNMNNLLSITDANGNAKTYSYDALNRRTTITDALGHSALISYDNNFNITSFRDFNNKIKPFTYDALNRRTSYTDALGNTTHFDYDAVNNLTSITDANNNTTSYIYDALNRNTNITFADGTTNSLAWDANGNLTGFTDNNGASTSYVYDGVNRLLAKDYPNNDNDVYTYDAGGRMLSAINDDATIIFSYDAANRKTSETSNGKTTSYSYNTALNKRTTIYPGGRSITHGFDVRNRLSAIDENNTAIASFNYDNANRVLSKNYIANGTSTNFSYDANNRITSMLTNPDTKLNSGFGYDNNGNKLFENKLHRPDQSEQYGYDDEMRLTEFKSGTMVGNSIPSPLHENDFNYDALGNRNSVIQDAVTTNYTSNNMNAYTAINGISTITPQYDKNGNIINDGTFTYSYDANNRITSVNNGAVSNYKYDALGRRISKTVGASTTNFYYSGNNQIENRDNASNVTATFIFGSSIDDIISSKINNTDFYYYKNALGSINAVANSTGNIVERYEYNPFGKINFFDGNYNPISSSQIDNDIFFTGRALDTEIGKYYYRAREYDETDGRFQQRDPFGYSTGDMNLYTYVKNRPTRAIDPFGTIDCDQPSGIFDLNNSISAVVSGIGFTSTGTDAVINIGAAAAEGSKYWKYEADALKGLGNASRVTTVIGVATSVISLLDKPTIGHFVDVLFASAGFFPNPLIGLEYDLLSDITYAYTGKSWGENFDDWLNDTTDTVFDIDGNLKSDPCENR